jgi:hypothetical protein
MKRNNYQFTDLPVIDAGEASAPARAPRPMLWVLMVLLVASAATSVWVTRSAPEEPERLDPPAALPPSAREKEMLLGTLAESTSEADEDERLAALESLSVDVAVPAEEMQAALSRLFEEGEN